MLKNIVKCLVLLFPLSAWAATQVIDGIEWTYSIENDEVTIVDVPDSVAGDVKIPASINGYPVTCIGSNAFYGCSLMTGIEIPETLTTVEKTNVYVSPNNSNWIQESEDNAVVFRSNHCNPIANR